MSVDRHSALPVRTQADADERLQSKIIDYTVPGQGMEVDTDKNAHVEVHGNNPTGVDEILRLSELGAITPDGVYDIGNNSKPGNVGVVVCTRAATPGDVEQVIRQTGIDAGTVNAADIALHDESGVPYSVSNPLPVTLAESEGTEVHDYDTQADVAKDASDTHEYPAVADMLITGYCATSAGKMKLVVAVETAVASGVYANKFVHFNSTANPDIDKLLPEPIKLLLGQKIRLIRTNRDHEITDLYSTISGHTV